jgi:endonuclease/exonuclease/phosphatase family metal-dependent hydrolase
MSKKTEKIYHNKFLSLVILFCFLNSVCVFAISVCSWNIQDIGKSKNDSELEFIAKTIKDYDVVAIQEVVAGIGGAQAISLLADKLNRTGNKWDYIVSDPTTGSSYKSERYAYLWKTASVKLIGEPFLEKKFALEIDREPFFCTFKYNEVVFTLVNFHAITKSKQPEKEIKYFKFLLEVYPTLNLIFCGDFNCPQSHSVFNPLKKKGYKSSLVGQKTSLRQKCINTDCLASEYDNFFYNSEIVNVTKVGIIHFYKAFVDINEARRISDHCPIFIEF